MVGGIFSSAVWQLLNGLGSSGKSDRKSSSQSPEATSTRTSYREGSNLGTETNFSSTNTRFSDRTTPNKAPVSDWEQPNSENWEPTNRPNFAKDYNPPRSSPDIRREDTNYAYKFRKDKELDSPTSKTRYSQSSKENSNSESSKRPGSKNTEEVYDANYRTLNDVPPPSIPEDNATEDDDSEWI